MTQAQEIAKGLTEAQKWAVLHERGSTGVCRKIREKGLASTVIGTGMAWDARIILTPLGLEVRAILQEQANGA